MTMQAGAIKYTPTNKNGNWTMLCQIPQMAKAIDVGASTTGLVSGKSVTVPNGAYVTSVWDGSVTVVGLDKVYPGKTSYTATALTKPLYMIGTKYFTNSGQWYKNGLPLTSGGASQGGMAPSGYNGNGNDFLDSYFRSGLQTTATAVSGAGSSSGSANAQILKKTSAYWVAVTHLMYNLDMATINLAKTGANSTGLADAKANFDSIAAAFYGCGETNPVPLPVGPNGLAIAYPTIPDSTDTGIKAVTMSVYGLGNKRASNYNQYTLRSTQSSSTCTLAGSTCKKVAQLNILIADALNAGPTASNIAQIRDAVLTLFTQATQRYVAKLTLAAQLPGNGMGGSTNPLATITKPATNPNAGSYTPVTDGKQSTACGGVTSYFAGLPTQSIAAAQADLNPGMTTACISGTPLAGTCTNGQVNGINACSAGAPGASNGLVKAGTVDSNTLTFGVVQPSVSQVTAAAATAGNNPFQNGCTGSSAVVTALIPGAGTCTNPLDTTAATGECNTISTNAAARETSGATGKMCGGMTNGQIQRATRGIVSSTPLTGGTGATVVATQPPIACIDSTVCFNDVTMLGPGADRAGGIDSGRCVRLCDPAGAGAAPGVASATYAARKLVYSTLKTTPAGSNQPALTAITAEGPGFWDPITAAQASLGGFCCAALYYSDEGIGRDATTFGTLVTTAANAGKQGTTTTGSQNLGQTGFVPVNQYSPVAFTGGNMAVEGSPGSMCPVSGTDKLGVSEYENPQQVYQLEGQAFYAVMGGMQRSIVTPTSAGSAQASNAARQKKCSENITKMLKMNLGVVASTATSGKGPGGATCTKADALSTAQTATQQYCRGTDASAIQFPTWSVGIGSNTNPSLVTKYNVPNGYCYSNQCFDDLVKVATEPTFGGAAKLGILVSSPDMGSAPTSGTTSCGRANLACAPAPTGWTGAPVVMEKCTASALATGATGCDTAAITKQVGIIPVV